MEQDKILPYGEGKGEKKSQVAEMFDNISGNYDRLNRILSLGIDIGWRNTLVRKVRNRPHQQILDVATGTADLAITLAKQLDVEFVTGVDISEGMLDVGRQKVAKKELGQLIALKYGDSENLQYAESSFDLVTVAFGVRNFQNLKIGLAEMLRVLKPGGRVAILEFSKPNNIVFGAIYKLYFNYVLPVVGKLISKDIAAYTYLPESVNHFPSGKAFGAVLTEVGYSNIEIFPLTFGICSLYIAEK